MKLFKRFPVTILFLAIAFWNISSRAQYFGWGGGYDQSSTFAIQADGSCSYTNVYDESRALVVQQIRLTEESRNESDTSDENVPATTRAKPADTNALTDEQIIKKLESMWQDEQSESADADVKYTASISNATVRIETSRSFASLSDILRDGASLWRQGVIGFQSARFEQGTNGQLLVTLTLPPGMQRYIKTQRAALKLSGMKGEFRFIFPGKVLTSSLPETKGNSTALIIDAKKDESLDALMKVYNAPVVITAEAGGLNIPEPLESKTLAREVQARGQAGGELPITDAGPGFLAEAQSLTTTMVHVFPGGEDYFNNGDQSFGQRAGALVRAKIFAPKGRTLQSISGVHVLKATDDKGRDVSPGEDEDDETTSYSTVYSGSDEAPADSQPIQLTLKLPATDAQAINEIDGEAIVVTAGSWSEMSLTNLQENATNEIDLSAVLPGARAIIKKLVSKQTQTTIQLELKGPETIQRLDFKAKTPGAEQQMSSSAFERKYVKKGGDSTRDLTIQTYTFGEQGAAGAMFIRARYPQDLRRERVKFKLTALDLL